MGASQLTRPRFTTGLSCNREGPSTSCRPARVARCAWRSSGRRGGCRMPEPYESGPRRPRRRQPMPVARQSEPTGVIEDQAEATISDGEGLGVVVQQPLLLTSNARCGGEVSHRHPSASLRKIRPSAPLSRLRLPDWEVRFRQLRLIGLHGRLRLLLAAQRYAPPSTNSATVRPASATTPARTSQVASFIHLARSPASSKRVSIGERVCFPRTSWSTNIALT
jgi:hypothetical protein